MYVQIPRVLYILCVWVEACESQLYFIILQAWRTPAVVLVGIYLNEVCKQLCGIRSTQQQMPRWLQRIAHVYYLYADM